MIDANNYKIIADSLSYAQNEGSPMYLRMGDVLTSLQNNQVRDTDREKLILQNVVESTYEFILLKHKSVNPTILTMTTALQKHITHHAGSVDDYLSKRGVQVTEIFANLSTLAGYPIDSSNIEV